MGEKQINILRIDLKNGEIFLRSDRLNCPETEAGVSVAFTGKNGLFHLGVIALVARVHHKADNTDAVYLHNFDDELQRLAKSTIGKSKQPITDPYVAIRGAWQGGGGIDLAQMKSYELRIHGRRVFPVPERIAGVFRNILTMQGNPKTINLSLNLRVCRIKPSEIDVNDEELNNRFERAYSGPLDRNTLKTGLPTVSHKLINVPEPPRHFLPRSEDLTALKRHLLDSTRKPVGITGVATKTGVHGMGGVGKTVLAGALVRDLEVRQLFPDGIIWLTLGLTPQITALQRQVAQALGHTPPVLETEQQGRSYLSGLLAESTALIVFDDVWREEHLVPFNVLGPKCQMLITTRDAHILRRFGATNHSVDRLSEKQAVELLAGWSNLDIWGSHRLVGFDLVRECDCLPLAIAMIGARVCGKPDKLYEQLRLLRSRSLQRIVKHHAEYQYPHLLRAIEISVEMLKQDSIPGLYECYLDFAIFPEDTPVPPAVLHTLWRTGEAEEGQTSDALDRLVDLALLRRENNNRLSLHDLQRDYLRQTTGKGLTQRHARLVDAYAAECERRCLQSTVLNSWEKKRRETKWALGPNDGYFFQWLAWHMREAEQGAELRALLLEFSWIHARLEATDVCGAVGDYALCDEDREVRLVQQALSLSAHVLDVDPQQLTGQIVGRLASFNESGLRKMVKAARTWRGVSWLCPLDGNLRPPGTALMRSLKERDGRIRCLAISANGRLMVSGVNRRLRVWDVDSGRELRTLSGLAEKVNAIALSADGRRAVSGGACALAFDSFGELKIWDVQTGRELRALQGYSGDVTAVAMSADGRLVLAGGLRMLKIWDAESGQELRTFQGHIGEVIAVAMSADGGLILAADQDTLTIWDVAKGQELHTLQEHSAKVHAATMSADGRLVVSAEANMLKIWDVQSGQELRTLRGHFAAVTAVTMSADGQRAVSWSVDQTIKVWDAESGRELRTLQGQTGAVQAVAMSADGRQAVSGGLDRTINVWDLECGEPLPKQQGHSAEVKAVVLSMDGRRAVSLSNDQMLKVWDVEKGREVATLTGCFGKVNAVVMSANGWRVLSEDGATVKIWDAESGRELYALQGHSAKVNATAMSVDGRWVVSGSDGKGFRSPSEIKVWDVQCGRALWTFNGHSCHVGIVAMSADGQRVVSGFVPEHFDSPREFKVWDVESGRELHTLRDHAANTTVVTLSADGRRAVSVGRDQTLKVWDLERGLELRTLKGHVSAVSAVVLSANGRRAVSGASDQTIKLWDVDSGFCLATFTVESRVTCCDVSSDGRTIIAGEQSGRIHFLRLVMPDAPVVLTRLP